MIFKIAFLILLLYLFSTDKDCEELEELLYFTPSNEIQTDQTEVSDAILPDVSQALSPEEIAQNIFDEI